MFFVRGLSSYGREVFVNPDQVLYVCPAGLLRKKTALILAYSKRLIVDQDIQTVKQRFEDYLKDVVREDDALGAARWHRTTFLPDLSRVHGAQAGAARIAASRICAVRPFSAGLTSNLSC